MVVQIRSQSRLDWPSGRHLGSSPRKSGWAHGKVPREPGVHSQQGGKDTVDPELAYMTTTDSNNYHFTQRDACLSTQTNTYNLITSGVYWRIMGFLWLWTIAAAYFVIYHRLICVCAYYLISWCVIPPSLQHFQPKVYNHHASIASFCQITNAGFLSFLHRLSSKIKQIKNKSGFGDWTSKFFLARRIKPTKLHYIRCLMSAVKLCQIEVMIEWVHSFLK